jgi:hypothetical protein
LFLVFYIDLQFLLCITTKNQTKSKYLHSHYAQLQKVVSILISLEVRVKM